YLATEVVPRQRALDVEPARGGAQLGGREDLDRWRRRRGLVAGGWPREGGQEAGEQEPREAVTRPRHVRCSPFPSVPATIPQMEGAMWQGTVVSLQIAPGAAVPMVTRESVEAVAGKGLAGDRYFHRAGTYSERPGSGRQVTLIEAEAVEAIAREAGVELASAASRRNVTTRGVPLNHLVGRRFRGGEGVLEGTPLCDPCQELESLSTPGVLTAMVHRDDLRAAHAGGGDG